MMIKRKDSWLAAKVGDEMVMMSVDSGLYLGLNDVGARVWDLIEVPRDLQQICTILSEEFDVTPDVCRPEIEAFLADLEKRGAVSLIA